MVSRRKRASEQFVLSRQRSSTLLGRGDCDLLQFVEGFVLSDSIR